MAFNGSGVFLRVMNWQNDASSNIKIRADRHDQEDNNLAAGLTQCITKDGQTTITANLPMSGYRHIGVGNAANLNEYATVTQVQNNTFNYSADTGTANAYVAAASIPPSAYVAGQMFAFKASNTNTGASTINVNSLGIKAIKVGSNDVSAGQILSGVVYYVQYDGTNFQIINPSTSTYDLTRRFDTGDFTWSILSSKSGWVIADGKTIGNASSSATSRANNDTQALFIAIWNSMDNTVAPVSGGRGASGLDDFNANKTITIPDLRGRTVAGKDDMGGTAANRITNAIAGFVGTVLGAFGGDQNMHQHTHTATQVAHTHNQNGPYSGQIALGGSGGGSDGVYRPGGTAYSTSSAQPAITVQNAGAGNSQNVQPTLILNGFFKL